MKLKDFEQELRSRVKGDVYLDEMTLGLYSTDASIYQIKPTAVVVPRDEADVCACVETASKYNVNILPRGGGTSLNGQCVSAAMVIDFTKYMNEILELNVEERWVRVQPGIVLDELNAALAEQGLFFAPDPATGDRAAVGGMMGNNASGGRSIVYGITSDHVLEVKTLLSDGTVLEFKELSGEEYDHLARAGDSREAQIYDGFRKIIDTNRDEIEKRFPKVMRRVQGYNLDSFINGDRWNLAKLMVGSEGTLGVFLEAKLHLEPVPKYRVLCAVHFAELLGAIREIGAILKHEPSAVEIIDSVLISRGRGNPVTAELCGFIEGEPEAILTVEFIGDTAIEVKQKAEAVAADLKNQGIGFCWPVITDAVEQDKVLGLRKNGLRLMLDVKSDRRPLAFIEDACVPIEVLGEYIDRILKFCKGRDVPVAMYGHASVGNIHLRPLLNPKDRRDIENMKAIADFAFELVCKYGGSWSGEHGDGRVRSVYLERFFGQEIYNALRDVKRLFDPAGLMNPGVIIDPNPIDEDLRYTAEYRAIRGRRRDWQPTV